MDKQSRDSQVKTLKAGQELALEGMTHWHRAFDELNAAITKFMEAFELRGEHKGGRSSLYERAFFGAENAAQIIANNAPFLHDHDEVIRDAHARFGDSAIKIAALTDD